MSGKKLPKPRTKELAKIVEQWAIKWEVKYVKIEISIGNEKVLNITCSNHNTRKELFDE